MVGEDLLSADGAEQAIRRLRGAFIPALKGLAPTRFIEVYRPKHLRLSTHPRYITFDRNKLLNHPHPAIAELAEKL